MKEKFKTISILLLGLLLFGLVGCGSDKTADKKNPPTNQEYYDYLTELIAQMADEVHEIFR